jgi:hypothetical protein
MSNLNLNPIPDPAARTSARGSTDTRLEIDATRPRQTERPGAPFRSVLAGGVSLLMTGAEVATHVVGGPVLAAAVRDARVGATAVAAGAHGAGATGLASPPAALTAGAAGGATGHHELAGVENLMQTGQASNLQLLALQQQVQQENQRFTTLSNVMRAKHDTAKAAVSNIRA